MTLRDCTLFVQVPRELISDLNTQEQSSASHQQRNDTASEICKSKNIRGIRIVIADLDEKSENKRGEYWKSLENQLIDGGYYLGHGKLDSSAVDCDFTDVVWSSDQVTWNGCAF
jgi:Inositol-pentakisphosphate 2-kinase